LSAGTRAEPELLPKAIWVVTDLVKVVEKSHRQPIPGVGSVLLHEGDDGSAVAGVADRRRPAL